LANHVWTAVIWGAHLNLPRARGSKQAVLREKNSTQIVEDEIRLSQQYKAKLSQQLFHMEKDEDHDRNVNLRIE